MVFPGPRQERPNNPDESAKPHLIHQMRELLVHSLDEGLLWEDKVPRGGAQQRIYLDPVVGLTPYKKHLTSDGTILDLRLDGFVLTQDNGLLCLCKAEAHNQNGVRSKYFVTRPAEDRRSPPVFLGTIETNGQLFVNQKAGQHAANNDVWELEFAQDPDEGFLTVRETQDSQDPAEVSILTHNSKTFMDKDIFPEALWAPNPEQIAAAVLSLKAVGRAVVGASR